MLAKAAPPDWARWFAAVTGQPEQYVRHKLGMTPRNDTLEPQIKRLRPVREHQSRSLATETFRSPR